MKKARIFFPAFVLLLSCLFGVVGVASALDIVLEPAKAQREVGGKVRVHIYADNADSLISMGVKVIFNPSVLQVFDAKKYSIDADTGWVMDGDGDPLTTEDQYRTPDVEIDNTNGSVVMIGGNLNGTSTTGLSGKVLLGWIVFEAMANGVSDLGLDRGKYHPNDPTSTFDNFVSIPDGLGGFPVVEDPTIVFSGGTICVVDNACEGDINGDGQVDRSDSRDFKRAFDTAFPDEGYAVGADFNADGLVNRSDSRTFKGDFNRGDCPACP